jgi:hypothetical protein
VSGFQHGAGTFGGIQPESSLPLIVVGPVTAEAQIGEDRADLTVEVNLILCGK